MKHFTVGIFARRRDAEEAIHEAHAECGVPTDDISYIYRNTMGDVREVDVEKVSGTSPAKGAGVGATTGAVIGGIAGVAAVAGTIPVLGPVLVAGPLVSLLGITSAVGATTIGAAAGAAAGGLIGGLARAGVGEARAQEYADRVMAGDVLVGVYAEEGTGIAEVFRRKNAIDTETYVLRI